MLEFGEPRRPTAMSAAASGLGAQICSTAQQAGVTALRCYDTATQQGLGYAAVFVFVLLIAGWRGLGRQP